MKLGGLGTVAASAAEGEPMRDAFGRLQSLVVFGGSSELGAATAERLVRDGCSVVVLAGRSPAAMAPVADRLRSAGAERVETVAWDALDVDGRPERRDVDGVLLAAGVLGDQAAYDADPTSAATAIAANYGGPVSTLLHAAARLKGQGHGTIVVLSSVAGERVRKANYVYGSSKAGLDAFAQGLGDALVGSGARVLVVRPGWVRTRMTDGMDPAPFPTTAEAVADAVAEGLAKGRDVVWVPPVLRAVFATFRHLPRPVWRRVAAGR
jgi:decaprenylphospho-beta-D-erythro-pentofuranosid-2-ulose 2-reductase